MRSVYGGYVEQLNLQSFRQLYRGPRPSQRNPQRSKAGQQNNTSCLVHGGEVNGDEVQQCGDTQRDLRDGGHRCEIRQTF
jgi:hypothetical protein